MSANTGEAEARGANGAGFEAVLAAAAFRGGFGRMLPARELGTLAGALVRKPDVAGRRVAGWAQTVGGIIGGDDADPTAEALSRDLRFADRAWQENPILNRLARTYLASCDAVQGVIEDADVDWRTRERLRMPADNLVAALAPTNTPLLNPAGWKELIDTGGANAVRGLRHLVEDLQSPARLPKSVDREAFQVGDNLAATPGKIVHRSRMFELIEYAATTDEVDSIPTVLLPSPVNKYYLIDLEPGQSVVAELVAKGRRVFVPSFVQPDCSHADVGFDGYTSSVLEVLDTVAEITGADQAHLMGLCGGGLLAALAAAYLSATGGQDRLATLTIAISVLDYETVQSMAFLDLPTGERAIARASARGYFSAAESARAFALMRPVDGIWSHVANNYVLGRKPLPIGLLHWAADQTNMTVRFGADLIRAAVDNLLLEPGGVSVLGVPVDLSAITVDAYVLGGSSDHISPWEACFGTVPLLGGDTRFVLASGGHATVIARPPSDPRASHWVNDGDAVEARAWMEGAGKRRGSWWLDWADWIDSRTPARVPAPACPGSATHPPLMDAPGENVLVVLT